MLRDTTERRMLKCNVPHATTTSGGTLCASQVVFVFVSDIGVFEMEQLLIQFEVRSDIPVLQFEKVVKSALDAQWRRLNFGKVIDKVRGEASMVK